VLTVILPTVILPTVILPTVISFQLKAAVEWLNIHLITSKSRVRVEPLPLPACGRK